MSGLPRVWVLVWFPVLVVVVLGVLTALGISGSSTGNYWGFFGQGADPHLLAGSPRPIRTDEWLVQSSWIVSQVQQGFPVVNHTLPGGMDATIQNDLPSWDWSTVFRPHVWGFLVLPLAQGMAVRWWLPFAGLLVGAYVFLVSVMPRRPVSSAMLAVALAFSPLIGWWFLPTTIWPYAWAFAVLVAVVWGVRSSSRVARWVSAGVAGYLTVTLAMSIYVPYAVPAVVVVAFVAVGMVLQARFSGEWPRWWPLLRRVVPLVSSAVLAVVVLGVWIVTRLDTIKAVLDTVYPGHRLEHTGALPHSGLVAMFSGPFQQALQGGVNDYLSFNQSEASAPMMLCVFLVPVLAWLAFRGGWRASRIDWVALGVLAAGALVFAFLLVPGWDRVAHLLLLDRSTTRRLRLAFDLLNVVGFAVVAMRLDQLRRRGPWVPTALAMLLAGGATLGVWAVLRLRAVTVIDAAHDWRLIGLLLVLAVVFVARRFVLAGAAAFLVATLLVGLGVNPLYRGVFELPEDTKAGRAIEAIEAKDPDAQWVGVGTTVQTAMLVESGVHAFNGVQTYPPEEMWREIDPTGRYEDAWNRLANVNWTPGTGEPVVSNPYRDQVSVTFDACSSFAQRHVQYVLTDSPLSSSCLTQLGDYRQGGLDMHIYRVR
ncbi:DUF7657 domain-containing protein [Curtobacterium citreum]